MEDEINGGMGVKFFDYPECLSPVSYSVSFIFKLEKK